MWLLLLTSLALADEPVPAKEIVDKTDYVIMQQGDKAPFSGFLLTDSALATIVAKHNEEIQLQSTQHTLNLTSLESKYKLDHGLLELQYKSEIQLYQEMITVRDEQIRNNARKDVLRRWGVYGGFVLGAASSIAIFYSVNHN